MASDDDIAAFLPTPPRPAPAKRAAAIDAAMRRFDGVDDAPRAAPDRAGAARPPPPAFLVRAPSRLCRRAPRHRPGCDRRGADRVELDARTDADGRRPAS